MMVNLIMRMLAYDLERRGLSDPLRQYMRFSDMWNELARLQGEPLPPDIADIVKEHPFSGMQPPKLDGAP